MLTPSDLQAIKTLIQDEGKKLIREEGQTIRSDISSDMDKKLKPLKNDVSKIKKDIDVMVRHFDREDTDLRRRMTRVEKHLSLPPME